MEYAGYLAGMFSLLSLIPQSYSLYKNRYAYKKAYQENRTVHIAFTPWIFSINVAGYFMWIVYALQDVGVMKNLAIMSAVCLVANLALCFQLIEIISGDDKN